MIENKITLRDCMDVLTCLDKESIDLVLVDIPYFNQADDSNVIRPEGTAYAAPDDDWDKFDSTGAYKSWCLNWMLESFRVLAPKGSMLIMTGFTSLGLVLDIVQTELEANIINVISWCKPNSSPNFRGVKLKNDVEYIIWLQPKKRPYTFNYNHMKEMNGGTQMGSYWQINICSKAERLYDEAGQKIHTTQKPEELITRLVLMASNPGDVILDFFCGTGTTGIVAYKYGREFLISDRDEKYVSASVERFKRVTPENKSLWTNKVDERKRAPRVSFQALVLSGLVNAGDCLYNTQKDVMAIVDADGRLWFDGLAGRFSIHAAGAVITGKSTNGWTFWHTDDGQLIDVLRDEYRRLHCDDT